MLDAIVMTFVSFFLLITWINALTAIPVILSTLFWFKKIKHTQVDKYYNKSWLRWFKSFFKK